MSRPVCASLDLSALRNNLRAVRRAAPSSRVWSVVKANAYGHGVDRVWQALSETDGFALLNLEEAILLRERGWKGPILLLEGFFHPDELTLASVFISCGILAMVGEITQLHAYTVKNGLSSLTSIANAMISGYSKCGSIVSALQAFRSILEPDLVSWTSMIGAYGFHGFPHEATELFKRMLSNGVKPDRIAFLEVLSSCGHGGLVNEGLQYFALMTDVYKLVPDPEHYACVVDLLGRVGLLK